MFFFMKKKYYREKIRKSIEAKCVFCKSNIESIFSIFVKSIFKHGDISEVMSHGTIVRLLVC